MLSKISQCKASIKNIERQIDVYLNNDVSELQKDFAFLEIARKMKTAYEAALKEVSRRREFSRTTLVEYQHIRELFIAENQERAKFISLYGEVIPKDFMPGLTHKLPDLPLKFFSEEQDLPIIEGLHEMKDSHLTVKGVIPPELKKAIEEMRSTLENTKTQNSLYYSQIQELQNKLYSIQGKLSQSDTEVTMLRKMNDINNEVGVDLVNYESYRSLTKNPNLSEQQRREIVRSLISVNSKNIFKCYAPLLAKRNEEITYNQKLIETKQEWYEKLLKEQEKKHRITIEEYIKKIETLNEKNIELGGLLELQSGHASKSKYNAEKLRKEYHEKFRESKEEFERIKKSQQNEHNKQLNLLREELDRWKSKADSLNSDLAQILLKSSSNDNLKTEINSLKEEVARLQDQVNEDNTSKLALQLERLTEENTSLASKYKMMKSNLEIEEKNQASLLSQLEQKDSLINVLKGEVDQLYIRLTSIDMLRKGSYSIYINFSKGIWVPLTFEQMVGEKNEPLLQLAPKLDSFEYFLDIKSFDPQRMKELERSHISIICAKTQNINIENVSAEENLEFLPFVEEGSIKKIYTTGDLIGFAVEKFNLTFKSIIF